MQFLRKNTKVIKVTGTIQTLGEYQAPVELRVHAGVTIIDEDGDTIHFTGLLIPKSLGDKIKIGEKMTLNIIRFKGRKNKLVGSVYAVKGEEGAYYDNDLSSSAINKIIRVGYKRLAGSDPYAILLFSGFSFVVLWAAIGFQIGDALTGGILSGLLVVTFYSWPFLVPNFAKVKEHVHSLEAEGYNDVRLGADKY